MSKYTKAQRQRRERALKKFGTAMIEYWNEEANRDPALLENPSETYCALGAAVGVALARLVLLRWQKLDEHDSARLCKMVFNTMIVTAESDGHDAINDAIMDARQKALDEARSS